MILASEHMVAFTGAGISKANGICDYKSACNEVLANGLGR